MPSTQLLQGNCLERMKEIPGSSVDMILAGLPYGTTQNKWDSVLPLNRLWDEYARLTNWAVVLTASQPFTSILVTSHRDWFRYAWVWEKSAATGHLNAKRMPMKLHEEVLVFSEKPAPCNPQGLSRFDKVTRRWGSGINFGSAKTKSFQEFTNYPRSILRFGHEGRAVHPTQKPVALMEYLIRTYTNEGETVLDNTMGSGTTGVACVRPNRNFIGIEMDDTYFEIAKKRIEAERAGHQPSLLDQAA